VMTELAEPTAVRLTVSFCSAVWDGAITVEGVRAERWRLDDAGRLAAFGFDHLPVFVDPDARLRFLWNPDVVVDARIAKRNLDNSVADAPLVVGLGPGLFAGRDVHVVVETDRGPKLGALVYEGETSPDTGIPGVVAGYAAERVLRAPVAGRVRASRAIGDPVQAGDLVGTVDGAEVRTVISGMVRGFMHDGLVVPAGLKVGDVDPRFDPALCRTFSDKARRISDAVLEAIRASRPSRR
ncbi:MAG: selenium-dependent molybdenum cofactor biosynthesis protein YqeB, partial [Myxococcaceae bacterium]